MPQITLRRALRTQKRLAGMSAKVRKDILDNNSVVKGRENLVDVAALSERLNKLSEAIVKLKIIVLQAGMPIRWEIYQRDELKGAIAFLTELNTFEGLRVHDYHEGTNEYVAAIKRVDVDARTKALQILLDDIVDRTEQFNNVTMVEVPDDILQLLLA